MESFALNRMKDFNYGIFCRQIGWIIANDFARACALHHHQLAFSISCMSSLRASCLSKKTPRIALVVMSAFCFLTPRHRIQPWDALNDYSRS